MLITHIIIIIYDTCSHPIILQGEIVLGIVSTTSDRFSIPLQLLLLLTMGILQLLHTSSKPFDQLAEFIGDLCMFSGQLAMLVPPSFPILPVWQIKLLECMQSISRIFNFISDLSDAFIDRISLESVLLVTHRPLVNLIGKVNNLGVELRDTC